MTSSNSRWYRCCTGAIGSIQEISLHTSFQGMTYEACQSRGILQHAPTLPPPPHLPGRKAINLLWQFNHLGWTTSYEMCIFPTPKLVAILPLFWNPTTAQFEYLLCSSSRSRSKQSQYLELGLYKDSILQLSWWWSEDSEKKKLKHCFCFICSDVCFSTLL